MADEPVYPKSFWSNARWCVNTATADVCQDYPRRKVIEEPMLRTSIRFIVAMLTTFAVIITISSVYMNSVNSRTVRHWGTGYLLSLPTSQRNYPNLLCPCNKSAIPWPYFVEFYWINQTESDLASWNRYPITNETQFCDPLVPDNETSEIWRRGCYSMGQSLTAYTNITMRTTVSTNTVTGPSVLAHIISVDMQNNVNDVFSDYAYLVTNTTADWVQLAKVKQMFSRAAHRFVTSTKFMHDQNATNDVYWRFFKGDSYTNPTTGETTKAFSLTGRRALVLEMKWAVYVDQCNPLYCDQVVKNSLLRRFATAATAVGGFVAVMIVVMRVLLWPCIRFSLRWPS